MHGSQRTDLGLPQPRGMTLLPINIRKYPSSPHRPVGVYAGAKRFQTSHTSVAPSYHSQSQSQSHTQSHTQAHSHSQSYSQSHSHSQSHSQSHLHPHPHLHPHSHNPNPNPNPTGSNPHTLSPTSAQIYPHLLGWEQVADSVVGRHPHALPLPSRVPTQTEIDLISGKVFIPWAFKSDPGRTRPTAVKVAPPVVSMGICGLGGNQGQGGIVGGNQTQGGSTTASGTQTQAQGGHMGIQVIGTQGTGQTTPIQGGAIQHSRPSLDVKFGSSKMNVLKEVTNYNTNRGRDVWKSVPSPVKRLMDKSKRERDSNSISAAAERTGRPLGRPPTAVSIQVVAADVEVVGSGGSDIQ